MFITIQTKTGHTASQYEGPGEHDLYFRACPRCGILCEWDIPYKDAIRQPSAAHKNKCSR